jgi:hypothetical protein
MFNPFAGWTKTLVSEPAPLDVVDVEASDAEDDAANPSERDIA